MLKTVSKWPPTLGSERGKKSHNIPQNKYICSGFSWRMIHGDPTHTQTHTRAHAHIHTHAPQRHTEPFSLNGQSSQEWKRGSSWKKTGNRGDGRRKEKPRGQRSLLEEQAESDSLIVEELGRGLSARVSAGLVLDSGNLHAPFPCDALQVVGWTVCGHLQLWDVFSASASCVVYFSGLFFTSADLTCCYWQGEFTWSGVCLEELLLFWCLLNCFFFPTSADLLTLYQRQHIFFFVTLGPSV